MSIAGAVALFLCGLVVSLAASEVMVRGVAWLGARLALSGGIVGLLVALGADAPEISSAISALALGARDVGVGVIVGSNLFNLAALLGLAAVVAGGVSFRRIVLLVDGGFGLLLLALVALLVAGSIGAGVAIGLIALSWVPYLAILVFPPQRWRRSLLPAALRRPAAWLAAGIHTGPDRGAAHGGSWTPAWRILPALVFIVAGSFAMVEGALTMSHRWHIPTRFTGTVVLAILTSLPNAYAAVRLALLRHGAAVVSETFNSNTINLVFGIAVPAVLIRAATLSPSAAGDLAWVLGLSLLAVALGAPWGRLTRLRGAALIAGYGAYLIVQTARGWT